MAEQTEQSPNSFEPPASPKSDSKKTYNMIIGVLGLLALLLVWSLTSSGTGDKAKEEAAQKAAAVESRNLMPGEDAGRGVAARAFPKPPEQNGLLNQPPPEPEKKEKGELVLVGPPTVDADDTARRQEEMEERRKKRDAYYAGLGSNILVYKNGDSAASQAAQAERAVAPQTAQRTPMTPNAYDPAADIDKEGFFERADGKEWRSPYTREAGQEYEIKTGAVIPGLMVTGVNSDLPGNIIAQVSQNVYDTATGNKLLVPQGARIFGAYDSRVVYGQSRVLVAWNRIVFPDGSAVTLGAMPGADMTGYAGFSDQVDNHYLRIFGSAILMSLITGGLSYAVDTVDNTQDSQNVNSTSMQDEMAAALAAQMGQTTMQLLEKNLSIKPTLEIRPGFRFNIVVTKDLVFRGPYVQWR